MALDITRLGEAITIDLPGGHPTSTTGNVNPDDVRAAGIAHPVELGAVPDGWILYEIELVDDWRGPDCSALHLSYQNAEATDGLDDSLTLDVTSADCEYVDGDFSQRVTLGSFTGAMTDGGEGVLAVVSDGRTSVEVFTDLPLSEVSALFEDVEPFDPASRPVPVGTGSTEQR